MLSIVAILPGDNGLTILLINDLQEFSSSIMLLNEEHKASNATELSQASNSLN